MCNALKRILAPVLALAAAGCSRDSRTTDSALSADSAPAPAALRPARRAGFEVTARGDTILLDGARFARAGLGQARVDLVPLRADLSEWAALVRLEGQALLLQPRGDEVLVLWSGGPSPPTLYLSYRLDLWLLDLDGDGDHELVSDHTALTDVGPELARRSVWRLDRASLRFEEAVGELAARAPAVFRRDQRREPRGLAAALGVKGGTPRVWSEADLVSPVREGELSFRGRVDLRVIAGTEVAQLVYAGPTPNSLAGEAFAVMTGVLGPRRVLAWRPLGPFALQVARECPPRLADRGGVSLAPIAGRPGFAVLVTWMSDSLTLSGNVLTWDGAALAEPPDPVVLLRCGGGQTAPAELGVAITAEGALAPAVTGTPAPPRR